MIRAPLHRREGFTLLEVLLASALAVVLMAALYVALDVQLRLAADGRDAIDNATLTRALVQRFENDVSGVIGPVTPPVGRGSGSSGMGMGMGTGNTASGADPAAAADPAMSEDAIMEVVMMTTTMQLEAGVIGESDGENRPRLTMFVAKVVPPNYAADESADAANPCDLRRVTYWMTEWGLARQELPWVTSEHQQLTTEPEIEDGKEERSYVIAEEVTRLAIEYWDGTAWLETWDGRAPGTDGTTLKGPPMAIRFRFWRNVPGPSPGEVVEREYRHTIAVRSAPGPASAPVDPTMMTTP